MLFNQSILGRWHFGDMALLACYSPNQNLGRWQFGEMGTFPSLSHLLLAASSAPPLSSPGMIIMSVSGREYMMEAGGDVLGRKIDSSSTCWYLGIRVWRKKLQIYQCFLRSANLDNMCVASTYNICNLQFLPASRLTPFDNVIRCLSCRG